MLFSCHEGLPLHVHHSIYLGQVALPKRRLKALEDEEGEQQNICCCSGQSSDAHGAPSARNTKLQLTLETWKYTGLIQDHFMSVCMILLVSGSCHDGSCHDNRTGTLHCPVDSQGSVA